MNLGSAYVDTMSFASHEVLPVAAAILVRDHWSVRSSDAVTGRIVTEWRPVKHLFARLFLGQIRQRCVVDVTPIDAKRCAVRFRAALASQKSIAGSPLMPRVAKEYEESVRNWQLKVRRALIEQRRGRS